MADSQKVKSPEGTKPESFDSRIKVLDAVVTQLTEVLLLGPEGSPNQRRARLLAILAALGHDGQSEMFEGPDGE